MDWVLIGTLALIDAVLLWWIFALKREIREIRQLLHSRPPREGVSEDDLQALQQSLSTLVESLETYTEENLAEMRQQVGKMRHLVENAKPATSQLGAKPQDAARPARTIRIQPDASLIEHREKERIIALHRQGKNIQEISRELQVTAGEVELVIKLTS